MARSASATDLREETGEDEYRHAQFRCGRQIGRDLGGNERQFVFVGEKRERVAVAPAVELQKSGTQASRGDADAGDNCDQVAGYFLNKAVALPIKLNMTRVS